MARDSQRHATAGVGYRSWVVWLRVQAILLGALLTAIILATLGNVIGRYVLNFALSWADEFSRLGLIVLTFIGGALAVAYRAHLTIDVLTPLTENRKGISVVLRWIIHVASLAFFVMLLVGGSGLAVTNFDQASPAMGIPLGAVYLCIPVGAAIMIINYIGSLVMGARQLPEVLDSEEIEEGFNVGTVTT